MSSDEPRPYSRPVASSRVSLKGGYDQPSDSSACEVASGTDHHWGAISKRRRAYRLDVEMAVDEDGLLVLVVTDPAQDSRRELEFLTIEGVRA